MNQNDKTSLTGLTGMGLSLGDAMRALFGEPDSPAPKGPRAKSPSKYRDKVSKTERKKRAAQSRKDRKRS